MIPVRTPTFKPTPKQLEAFKLLASPARYIMLVGGSRSGKTSTFVRSILVRAIKAPHSYHAILRFRGNAAQASISMDTLPKIHRLSFPRIPLIPRGRGNDTYFALPNESRIWVGGLDDKERAEKILGNEFSTVFLNETSQISYTAYTTVVTRLAQNVPGLRQRMYIDLNPTSISHWTSRMFLEHRNPSSMRPIPDPENYKFMFMNPLDNLENLTKEYIASLDNLPERQRKRFYEGKYVADVDGALWTPEIIERNRIEHAPPELLRVVVAIDPSGAGSKEDTTHDEIGIVAVGLGVDRHAYVLADNSCLDSPAGWGRRAVKTYTDNRADKIIAESNFGGEMVHFVIQTADRHVPVKMVSASRGKVLRAEPVSFLYEKNLVHHIGRFPQMEDQMCSFTTGGYIGEGSPDRTDALVFALTELMVTGPGPETIKAQEEEEYSSHSVMDESDAPWNLNN